jgi:poly(3-hydroxybutyrate) depolymerase
MPPTSAVAVAIWTVLAGSADGQPYGKVQSDTFQSDGQKRTYAWFATPSAVPRPLVIVLHGSGGNGKDMVNRWRDLARRESFVVAGPDARNPSHWEPPVDGPVLLRDLVDTLKPHNIDPRRVYLFGHSAGAIFALHMGPIESEYFAAISTHAGAFNGEADLDFLKSAGRRIPVHISAGTKDALFPMALVRATVQQLEAAGFPVTTSFVAGEAHSYRFFGEINERAWTFLRDHSLEKEPVFTPVVFAPR